MAELRYRQIFQFYLPLVLTSQMMTLAAPIINSGLGRSSNPEIQIAGYAVGFGILVFFNSPLFPFLQAVAVQGVGPVSRRQIFSKIMVFAVALFILELTLALHPGGKDIIAWLMGSTPEVSALAQKVFLVQSPIPLLLPIRSLFSGVVMRHHNTWIISQATGLRLALLSSIIFGSLAFGHMPGAVLGASSLTFGILTETIYMVLRAGKLLRRNASRINEPGADGPVSWAVFFAFIGPLMVNAVTWSSLRPLLNAVLGRTVDPDLAQAGFGFVFPLLVLFASPLWALQSTTVVLSKRHQDLPRMVRFAWVTISFFVVGIALIVWTPLRMWLLNSVYDLGPEMILYVTPALFILPYQPITLGVRTVSQGFLMAQQQTVIIGYASMIKVLVVALIGFPLVHFHPEVNGALLATLLMMGGETLESCLVAMTCFRAFKRAGQLESKMELEPEAA
ncbi:MAG: hypothetical protein GY835_15800 [bacterium]|nr:hypothetical protein [bacterium]